MSDPRNSIDVWDLMFNQIPVIARWALGVLTLGIFTLAGVLYRWHRDDLKEVHRRVDQLETKMDERHAETNRLLMQIATNTQRSAHRHDD